MNANEKREAVAAKYREIIGRNQYSQNLRNYCYKKYTNGKYYSDCSSSVSYAYKEAGFGFGILNTVGMYQCGKFVDVPVTIVKGQIKNPEVLRVGDMLLYAGTDTSRAYAGYVGHVEMVGEIHDGPNVILYGHGSGTPKKTGMVSKNSSRYDSRTSTKVGNKGLIRVVRFIQDDDDTDGNTDKKVIANGDKCKVKKGSWNIRKGPGKEYDVIGTVNGGTEATKLACEGWVYIQTSNMSGFISDSALEV